MLTEEMSVVDLFCIRLYLGADDNVDLQPRSHEAPNVFVPSHYQYLSDAFRQHFPEVEVPGSHFRFDGKQDVSNKGIRKDRVSSIGEQKSSMTASDEGSVKGAKRKRADDEVVSQDEVELECELIYSQVYGADKLGLVKEGSPYYETLAVVALLVQRQPPKNVSGKGNIRDNSYEDKMVETAWERRSDCNASERAFQSGIVLGHIVLSRIKHPDHPLNRLDSFLLRSRWINFSHCSVRLKKPFLSEDSILGPLSNHPIGRALPSLELDGRRLWKDQKSSQFWEECPHHLLVAPEVFGSVTFQIGLTERALQYGSLPQHDGFVDAVTVPRRNMTISAKLKDLVLDAANPHLADEYWSRTPLRYYDDVKAGEGSLERLNLDNRIETALEATRPRLDAPMLDPKGLIQTPLLPFQKKALHWMVSKEVDVSGDEGALLPHWVKLEFPDRTPEYVPEKVKGKRRKVKSEVDSSGMTLYMDTFTGTLSRTPMKSRSSEPGGCLCDSMGLGKSLTTLSLIETHQRTSDYVDSSRSAQMSAGMAKDVQPFVSTLTLLVVPSSLVHQWYSEINKHIGVKAEEDDDVAGYVLRYQRDKTIPWMSHDERQSIRSRAKEKLTGVDSQTMIVLATYEDLKMELQMSKKSKKAISPLLEVQWWRIVLDEAQLVSTSNGSAAEMVNCLWRTNGWIVTSTPFNSSIRDMFGLLTFLDSDFASPKLFDEFIVKPFRAGGSLGIAHTHALLKRIMWRHRKEHVENELKLPPSTMQTLLLDKTGLEKTLYDREYKKMLEEVRGAVSLGRGLAPRQQDRLLSFRKLISHPQLASNLGYGDPRSQRTTFANLFADLIFRNQGELYNAQMEFIVVAIKIAAGNKFRKEEKDSSMWKGGSCNQQLVRKSLIQARDYARQGIARDVASQVEAAARESAARETRVNGAQTNNKSSGEVMEEDTAQPVDVDQGNETEEQKGKEEKEEEANAEQTVEETTSDVTARPAAPATMRYEEALYWIDVLLDPKVDMGRTDLLIDPERLSNLFFEKKVTEANTVDLEDSRYHPMILDAGDEEEEVEESSVPNEAVLLKNKFRGNVKRSIKKVWYYHPKRKLQSLTRDVPGIEEKIAKLEGEEAYLQNRIREELGEERARLVLKEGFDALNAGNSEGEGKNTNFCPVCYEAIEIAGILPCLHTACLACLNACIAKIGLGGRTPCPMCRKTFEKTDIIEVLPTLSESDHVNEFGVKISGLISHIRKQLEQDSKIKIVIFSAWSSYLAFITEALNNLEEPIKSVAFSGKNNQSKAMKEFESNDQIRIMLVPMKMAEGAAGLTLNVASVAYLLEPSLDSALEDQALGRLNRIGQKAKKTTYFRVLAQNTIEPALVEVAQRRIKQIKDKNADTRHHDTLSVEELAFVFGLDVEEEKAKKKEELGRRAVMMQSVQLQIREQQQEVEEEGEDESMQDETSS